MLPGYLESCNAPIMPPGFSAAAVASCASFSQFAPVAEAMLIGAIAIGQSGFCLPALFRAKALKLSDRLSTG